MIAEKCSLLSIFEHLENSNDASVVAQIYNGSYPYNEQISSCQNAVSKKENSQKEKRISY